MRIATFISRAFKSPFYQLLLLLVMVLTIVLPITLSRPPRKALEIQLESRTPLFSDDVSEAGFSVLFNGELVPNPTKFVFVLLNSGSDHILESDVVSAPSVGFGAQATIFHTKPYETFPDDLHVSLVGEETSEVGISFPLLNPGDYVRFCVFTSGLVEDQLAIAGRVAGMKTISFRDKTREPVRASKTASFGQWILWGFTLFVFLCWGISLKEVRSQRRLRKHLARNPDFLIEKLHGSRAIREFIDVEMPFLLTKERETLKGEVPENETQAANLEAISAIKAKICASSTSGTVLIFFTILMLPGIIMFIVFLLA